MYFTDGAVVRAMRSDGRLEALPGRFIAPAGLAKLDALDAAVTAEQQRPFKGLREGELRELVALLGTVRERT